uniref:Transposase n=1 Tax=Globodera pallida TaxID=36090 RepID=A0A183BSP3_GLOPA
MFVKFLKKQQVEAGDRVLIRNYERHSRHSGELFSASYTPKRLYLNQVKKCFEMLGPTCTFPELPADKKEALDAVVKPHGEYSLTRSLDVKAKSASPEQPR